MVRIFNGISVENVDLALKKQVKRKEYTCEYTEEERKMCFLF